MGGIDSISPFSFGGLGLLGSTMSLHSNN